MVYRTFVDLTTTNSSQHLITQSPSFEKYSMWSKKYFTGKSVTVRGYDFVLVCT